MPTVFRQIHTVNSAAKIPAIKLERERTFVQIPPIFAIVLEISISFPWQWNTNQKQTMPYSQQIINRKGVWQYKIFCTENTIQTRHVNINVKNWQAAFEQQIRGAWASWNCITLRTVFLSLLEQVFFWISSPLKMGRIARPETSVRKYHYTLRNISEDGRSQFSITSFCKSFCSDS